MKLVAVAAVVAVVADVALPLNVPVIIPAEKLPDASRATIAFARLALFAVVAALATLPAVVRVASLLSDIAAPEAISALTINEVERAPDELLCTIPDVLNGKTVNELLSTASVRLTAPAENLPEASRLTITFAVLALSASVFIVISSVLLLIMISVPAINDLKLSVVPILSLKIKPVPAPTFAARVTSGKENNTKVIGSVSITAVGVVQSQLEPALVAPDIISTYDWSARFPVAKSAGLIQTPD